jgi:hypothetical protein
MVDGAALARLQTLQSLSKHAVFTWQGLLVAQLRMVCWLIPITFQPVADVTHVWELEGSFSVRRLVRDRGIVPIPRSLPGYRAALSLGQNQAWLTVGMRVTAAGSFAPGTNVLGSAR